MEVWHTSCAPCHLRIAAERVIIADDALFGRSGEKHLRPIAQWLQQVRDFAQQTSTVRLH